MSINVLIKSAGNKVHLIQEFQKYANVLVQDDDIYAKCFRYADCYVTGQKVDLTIETRDADIKHPICYDKLQFFQFCRRHGFPTPLTVSCEDGDKFIIKPRNGAGGKDTLVLDRKYIIQKYCDWPEYSADYFADENGKTLSAIVRQRLDVLNGESTKAHIIYNGALLLEVCRMGRELGIKGPACMQFFFNGKDIRWIEVNPRYGGGSHLTWHLFSGPRYQVEFMRDSNVSPTLEGNKVPEVR